MPGKEVFHRRQAAFADDLAAAGFVAGVICQPADLYYLSGTAQPCNLLVVPGQAPVLFARRFEGLVRKQGAVEDVVVGAGFGAIRERLAAAGVPGGKLGMELDVVPAALYRKACRDLPAFEIEDCSPQVLKRRAVKDPAEIEILERAARAFRVVHEVIVEGLRPGRTELELAAEVERRLRAAGHEGMVSHRRWDGRLAPEGAVASGPNVAIISGGPITISGVGLDHAYPLGASRRPLEFGDVFNIDIGINVEGYHADLARTYVLGEPGSELRDLAGKVRSIQDQIIAAIRPGRTAEEIYRVGRGAATALGVAEFFQGYGATHGPYVGHGLGLELDEPPVLGPGVGTEIVEGMVLAVEPKLISPAFGGVNLEDDVVVTHDGTRLLQAVERSVFAVEAGHATAVSP